MDKTITVLILLAASSCEAFMAPSKGASSTKLHQYDQLAKEWAAMNKDIDSVVDVQVSPVPMAAEPAPMAVYQPPSPELDQTTSAGSVSPYMHDFREWALRAIANAEKSSSGHHWWDKAGTGHGYLEPADYLSSDKELGVNPAGFGWELHKLRNVLNDSDFTADIDNVATQALRGQREPWVVEKVTKSGMMVSTHVVQDGLPNHVTIKIPFQRPVRNFQELRQAILDMFENAEHSAGSADAY